MTLADWSLYLFYAGALMLLFGFVLHVAHVTALAVGERMAGASVGRRGLAGAGASAGSGWGSGSMTLGDPGGRAGAGSIGRRRLVGRLIDGPGQERTVAGDIGAALAWLSLALMGLSMIIRGLIVGRGPWGNMYEFSIAFGVGILGSYLLLQRRYPIRTIGFVPLGVALFLIGYALTLPADIEPLVPALENAPLLTVHVAMAMVSYGILATSFGAAVGYLIQGPNDRVRWLPRAKVLDEVAYRAVIIGFPIFATLIILGSWWAAIAWGRYWGWDPKETSALVTWLIYAVYLHARTHRGWVGRPSALILVVGFGAVLFTYFGNLFFSGLHSYSGL